VTINTGTDEAVQTGEELDPAANAAAMVGHHYRVDDYYEVGREKVREYARAVQDYHPVHWDEDAAQEYGYDNLLAPVTFISLVGILAQRKLFEEVVTGYDLWNSIARSRSATSSPAMSTCTRSGRPSAATSW
jgi:acyl dehydratase